MTRLASCAGPPPRGFGGSGFTLIEILVVLGIIALLGAVLMPKILSKSKIADVNAAKSFIMGVAAVLDAHAADAGNYPPSSLDKLETGVKAPNALNQGIETLVAYFYSKTRRDRGERNPLADYEGRFLRNLDKDALPRSVTTFESPELFEIVDPWGNPYVYFHWKDYGDASGDRASGAAALCALGSGREARAVPWRNPKTRSYYRDSEFQLFSAGPDGEFNTDDDIGNW